MPTLKMSAPEPMLGLEMYKLRFLLGVYARGVYVPAAALLAAGAAATVAASFTPWAGPVALVFALAAGAVVASMATLGVLVLNAALAAALSRAIGRFEAAYDSYRGAHNIPDLFYEEMDRLDAEGAEAAEAAGRAQP